MRKIYYPVLAMLCFVLTTRAQDSTGTNLKAVNDSIKAAGPKGYNRLLYNYAAESITSVYDEDVREGASNRFTANFDYIANSHALPASFGFALLFKKEITDAIKDRVDNRIKNRLDFEDIMKAGFTYQHYFKKWGGSLYFSYNQRQMRAISGSKQTYELLFYGNARFEGDTADLSNLRVQNLIYNQYTLGIKKKVEYTNYQMVVGLGLSFIQDINDQEISTNNAWLYTAPDGERLDLSYDLTFNTAKEGAPKFWGKTGVGGTGDFYIGFMNKDKWKLSFSISDLGIMAFRESPVNYNGVNAISFSGIVLPDLTSFSSQTFDTLNLDSTLRSKLPTKSNNSYSIFMPFTANVMFSKPLLHDKLVLTAGLQYRHIPGYKAYGYVKVNYFIKPDMVISGSVGAGGYSLCNIGVEFAKHWKYFDFALGSANFAGLIAPSHYTGAGIYLRLGTSF